MRKLNFPEILGILFILAVSCIAIFTVLDNSDNEYELPDLNNSSIESLQNGYSYQDVKKECEALNGSIVNYSYGSSDSKTFVGCKL